MIVGTSNAGKSAVVRAINWVLHNDPSGEEFINLVADECRVRVEFSDSVVIERFRGRKNASNGITVYRDGAQLFHSARMGSSIPDEALKAMGNPPIGEGNRPLCYHSQKSPDFLVSCGPTELPRVLSNLIGIEDMEETAVRLGKRTREAKRDADLAKARVERCDLDLVQYEDVPAKEAELAELLALDVEIQKTSARLVQARNLTERYNTIKRTGSEAYQAAQAAKKVAVLRPKLTERVELRDQVVSAIAILEKSNSVEKQIKEARIRVDQSKRLCSQELKDSMLALKKRVGDLEAARSLYGRDILIGTQIQEIRLNTASISTRWAEAKAERKALVESLKREGLLCGECGQLIQEGAVVA
jgi:hypothetical protein